MNTMKVVGFVAAGVGLAALVGGGIWLWRRHKAKQTKPEREPKIGPTPSKPPRDPYAKDDEGEDEDATPKHWATKGHYISQDELDDELTKELIEMFPGDFTPNDEVLDNLTQEDVVIVAVESEPSGPYENTRQEFVTAKVLSVEKTMIRARIQGPIAHAEHHGSHAGHGFRVGKLIEVPRSKVLVAARDGSPKKTGYGSRGKPAATFAPSSKTKETYHVQPGTPYDLVLPYRTKELAWYQDRELVKMIHIGSKGPLEQVMFTEDSLRGDVAIRALDEDPEHGTIFVARWDFEIEA